MREGRAWAGARAWPRRGGAGRGGARGGASYCPPHVA